jgi:sec-independent protein translocase protein TatA
VFQVGPLEIALVAIIALIVLGPAKLPDAARAMGRGMREFKGALSGEEDEHEHEQDEAEKPAPPADPA